MKDLKKIKLNQLDQELLSEQEMNVLLGKDGPAQTANCNCGCGYSGSGGSSTSGNKSANDSQGIKISYGFPETPVAVNHFGSACGYWQINTNYYCENVVTCG